MKETIKDLAIEALQKFGQGEDLYNALSYYSERPFLVFVARNYNRYEKVTDNLNEIKERLGVPYHVVSYAYFSIYTPTQTELRGKKAYGIVRKTLEKAFPGNGLWDKLLPIFWVYATRLAIDLLLHEKDSEGNTLYSIKEVSEMTHTCTSLVYKVKNKRYGKISIRKERSKAFNRSVRAGEGGNGV